MTKKRAQESNWINSLLWLIYGLLLTVLLPHTAWAFAKGEAQQAGPFGIYWGIVTAWMAAAVFELVIGAMTHKLAVHISATPRHKGTAERFRKRYLNVYSFGLLLAWLVSTYANLAHAVEFGQEIKFFAQWGWPTWTYSVAFGAILPTASLLFAWVLSSVIEQDAAEPEANHDLDKAKRDIADLKDQLRQAETRRSEAEARAQEAETRFQAAGDIFVMLTQGPKRERVLIAARRWPEMPRSGIALLTETSPSYVTEVLKSTEVEVQ